MASNVSLDPIGAIPALSELEAQERYNDKYVILYDFRNLGTLLLLRAPPQVYLI